MMINLNFAITYLFLINAAGVLTSIHKAAALPLYVLVMGLPSRVKPLKTPLSTISQRAY